MQIGHVGRREAKAHVRPSTVLEGEDDDVLVVSWRRRRRATDAALAARASATRAATCARASASTRASASARAATGARTSASTRGTAGATAAGAHAAVLGTGRARLLVIAMSVAAKTLGRRLSLGHLVRAAAARLIQARGTEQTCTEKENHKSTHDGQSTHGL